MKLILSFGFVLRTAFRTPIFVLTIPKSRAEKRASAAVREINLAVAEHRLGVSNVQLSNVCQELADTKTLLNDTRIPLLGAIPNFFSASLVWSILIDQHLRSVEERDALRAAIKEYADDCVFTDPARSAPSILSALGSLLA